MLNQNKKIIKNLLAASMFASIGFVNAQSFVSLETPMMKGVSKNIKNGWITSPVLTIGETNNQAQDVNALNGGYRLPGILDGMGAFQRGANKVKVLINSELAGNVGYNYTLSNGAVLSGARISAIDMLRATRTVSKISIAYDRIFDRYGKIVTSATQVNEASSVGPNDGFSRFCSARGVKTGTFGFNRDLYFTGEETTNGQLNVTDVNGRDLYVVPMAGRAGWENVAPIENYNSNKVVMLITDDRGGAPLLLYVGEKGTTAAGYNVNLSALKQNGLTNGQLFVWVSDSFAVNGERDFTTFKGTNAMRNGRFVKFNHFLPAMKSTPGFDALGFPFQTQQDSLANLSNYFKFSRPEDLEVNPSDPTQVLFVSTGLSSIFNGVDSWGTTYLVDFLDSALQQKLSLPLSQINDIPASIKIIYSGDDAGNGIVAGPDFGLRSPDNVTWASNGKVYIQEDKSFTGFGLTSGIEASVWELDPATGAISRILEMDRNAVPFMQSDAAISDIGNWESSGILDVTNLFITKPGEQLLLLDVQAHSISNGLVSGSTGLVEGGQLLFASKIFSNVANKSIAIPAFTQSKINHIASEVKFFPNPAKDIIHFTEIVTVKLSSAEGAFINGFENTRSIDISSLNPGTYILQFNDGHTSTFIKE